ncbi:MAG: ABC transporter permease subunit, partial [bacterium]
YTYFKDIPQEILEAAQMECDGLLNIFLYILLPLSKSAIFSTSLLSIVLIWNESFWSLNLTAFEAAPLTTFISSYSSPEGLFWAKLSAASTLAILPIMFLGWVTQKQMVKGLTLGAVK